MQRVAVIGLLILAGCRTAPPPDDGLDDLGYSGTLRHRPDFDGVEAALAEVHAGIRARPDWVEGWTTRGHILAAAGFWQNALRSYDAALALNPKHLDALMGRGLMRAIHGRSVDAQRDFDAVIEAAPEAPDGYLMRAWLERRDGRYSESERDLAEARARDPGRWEAYHNAGVAASRAKRWETAGRNFELSVMLRPDHAEGWIALSRVHAAQLKPDLALEDLDRADMARPGNAAIWYARGELLRSLGRPAEAVRSYDCAISLGAQPIMYASRGQARAAVKDAPGAESDFDRALELEPDLREAWVARARWHAAAGRFDKARDDYAAALRLRASASVLRDMGRLHHDKELWTPAVTYYESALKICAEDLLRSQLERDLSDARARRP